MNPYHVENVRVSFPYNANSTNATGGTVTFNQTKDLVRLYASTAAELDNQQKFGLMFHDKKQKALYIDLSNTDITGLGKDALPILSNMIGYGMTILKHKPVEAPLVYINDTHPKTHMLITQAVALVMKKAKKGKPLFNAAQAV